MKSKRGQSYFNTGTVIRGQPLGTVHINGRFDDQLVNGTVQYNTVFEWERI
jgi:hypothetical protein